MKIFICHAILSLYYRFAQQRLSKDLQNCEQVQRERLQKILKGLSSTEKWKHLVGQSYESCAQAVALTDYKDYAGEIYEQRQTGRQILCSQVTRYEPTSGSTEVRKWIPYSKLFLEELNTAAAAWLGDLYNSYPEIRKGRHFWSLSWLPEDLRSEMSSDDADLFPFYQRLILKNTMLIPSEISRVSSSATAWWASLLLLVSCEDLTLISVWSPTYILKIMKDIETHFNEIKTCLQIGSWGAQDLELRLLLGAAPLRDLNDLKPSFDDQFWKRLWPQLVLASAWDSSTSALWAAELKRRLPRVSFQGKGLWATEGVVTIPFSGHKVLAIDSHFYEFKDLLTTEIVPAWQVQVGREYQPILWTSGGLLRYQLQDRLRVVSQQGDTPAFEFMGRLQSLDLVGEKIGAAWVSELFAAHPEWGAVSLFGVHQPYPYYALILTGHKSSPVDIESALLEHHHYRLARELGQLSKAQSFWVENALEFVASYARSPIVGQNKMEVLVEVSELKVEA